MLGKILHLLVLLPFMAGSLSAANYTVNTLSDTHDFSPGDGVCADHAFPDSSFCSLRAAVEEADARPGADTVIIPADTLPIRLNLGALELTTDSTVIIGHNPAVIDAVNNPMFTCAVLITSNYNQLQGVTVKRSRYHGILIEGSGNIIGGTTAVQRNVIVGNGIDNDNACGIYLSGPGAVNNIITGNFIGMYDNGTRIDGNRNGIGVADRAAENVIGGLTEGEINLISGNVYYGLIITNKAIANRVLNNIIGPDITGGAGPGNGRAGIRLAAGAQHNQIGADSYASGNHIALNLESGIEISGSGTDYNLIQSNYIGCDITGLFSLGNETAGVLITDGARYNLVGGSFDSTGNLISGNRGDGVLVTGSGTSYNIVAGNLVGTNQRGSGYLSNGTVYGAGVTIAENATENIIGGETETARNIISGNQYYGVYFYGNGTGHNRVTGNFIGVNLTGTSSLSNGSGVVLRYGASDNQIGGENEGEGNIISGNRSDIFPFSSGVVIYDAGTDYNVVAGNLIGASADTTRALRNGISGVIIGNGARHNLIGGETPAQANIICGNGSGSYLAEMGRGVHIFGTGTEYNRVSGNFIGTNPRGDTTIGNQGHGIGLGDGAARNVIGGTTKAAGNIISVNEGHGIFGTGAHTRLNSLRHNRIFGNDSLGIALRDNANDNLQPPVLDETASNYVSGHGVPPYATVDIYLAAADPSGRGEGREFIGADTADSLGFFTVNISTITTNDTVTAQVTDSEGNSSEFSLNLAMGVFTGVDDDNRKLLPKSFSLTQNYPNPFNPVTRIEYNLPQAAQVKLAVYNTLGQRVRVLVDEYKRAGRYVVEWNSDDESGQKAASGIYLYRLETSGFTASRKMLLLK